MAHRMGQTHTAHTRHTGSRRARVMENHVENPTGRDLAGLRNLESGFNDSAPLSTSTGLGRQILESAPKVDTVRAQRPLY
eukprot:7141579-Prymnesium_polylepis.1